MTVLGTELIVSEFRVLQLICLVGVTLHHRWEAVYKSEILLPLLLILTDVGGLCTSLFCLHPYVFSLLPLKSWFTVTEPWVTTCQPCFLGVVLNCSPIQTIMHGWLDDHLRAFDKLVVEGGEFGPLWKNFSNQVNIVCLNKSHFPQ